MTDRLPESARGIAARAFAMVIAERYASWPMTADELAERTIADDVVFERERERRRREHNNKVTVDMDTLDLVNRF